MKLRILIFILLILICPVISGQTRSELEEKRQRTLEEIDYVDNMLKNTEKKRSENISSLRILGNKLNLRESVISGMNEEMDLLNERIGINNIALDMMESDLTVLKEDYSRAIVNFYRYQNMIPEMIYILSAKDFNQGYKRLKYLQQISKFRRNEAEVIIELKDEIGLTRSRLESDLARISDLRQKEVLQKDLLQKEQNRKKKLENNLGKKEKELKRELDEKKRIAKKIENEIARIIEEEKRKNVENKLTPEQKLIGDDFEENKGRLPWPVEKGVITSNFGIHKHPVLKYVTENNIGIEITSSGKTKARSVFKGEVTAITAIKGANMTVIIRHGNYISVYTNLINVRVKKGDKVDTKQEIGDVYQDPADNNNSVIKFMIFNKKYLDPEFGLQKTDIN